MAKLYDFRFVVRHAEFNRGMVTVPYGGAADVYREECAQLTLPDALKKLAELSAQETRNHAAFLTMKYRDDAKPRGFDKAKRTIYHEAA